MSIFGRSSWSRPADQHVEKQYRGFNEPPSVFDPIARPPSITVLKGEKARTVQLALVWARDKYPIDFQILSASGTPIGPIESCDDWNRFDDTLVRMGRGGAVIMRQKYPPEYIVAVRTQKRVLEEQRIAREAREAADKERERLRQERIARGEDPDPDPYANFSWLRRR